MGLVQNITNDHPVTKKAAMYYKIPGNDYGHTNNWEINAAIKILNKKGYSVDLIDRGNHNWQPTINYDLFLGLGVGNTGNKFSKYANRSNAPLKVLLAMGPQPDVSQQRTLERYEMFNKRTGRSIPPMRTVGKVIGDNWKEIINTASHVFCIGERGTPSYDSFLGHGKPVLNFYPGVSPAVSYDPSWLDSRDRSTYLCFAGNGFICKGVDIVLEAFMKDPSKQLHICGPNSERAFFDYYSHHIARSPNIKYHGFIAPGGSQFNELAAKCSYVVFNSASEGCCTSVATAINAGLVPIINSWTGILIDDEGFGLNNDGDLIENISETINFASSIDDNEYHKMVGLINEKAKLFSQESFIESYTKAIESVI